MNSNDGGYGDDKLYAGTNSGQLARTFDGAYDVNNAGVDSACSNANNSDAAYGGPTTNRWSGAQFTALPGHSPNSSTQSLLVCR